MASTIFNAKTTSKDGFEGYFDNIIGYQSVKDELFHVLDCMTHKERYEKVGAHVPNGLMLYGRPGVGKTVMAKDFIKASGRKAFAFPSEEGSDLLINRLEFIFKKAAESQPSIILLDDLDKYGDEVNDNSVYLAIQAMVDRASKSDIFIVSTLNDTNSIPESLRRAGRFDYYVEICPPADKDQALFIEDFMKHKPFDKSIQSSDVVPLISGRSCASIISFFNEVAIHAGYKGEQTITINDIVEANSRVSSSNQSLEFSPSNKELAEEVAYHEVGHMLLSEACVPESVGFVSIYDFANRNSYCVTSNKINRRPHCILIGLGGKACYEMKFGKLASGCSRDIESVRRIISDGIIETGTSGFSSLSTAVMPQDTYAILGERINSAVTMKFEESFKKAQEVIALNRDFIEEAVKTLITKGFLLKSDIKAISAAYPINRTPIIGI